MKLFSKNSNLCDHNSPTLQTDRQTTCDRNTALCTKVHRAVKTVDVMHPFTVLKRYRPDLPLIERYVIAQTDKPTFVDD